MNIYEEKPLVGFGEDSIVYLLDDDTVIKSYVFLSNKVGLDSCLSTIKKYDMDTLNAARLVKYGWSKAPSAIRQINLHNKSYDIKIHIIPQGNAQVINGQVISSGQKYISGETFQQFLNYPALSSHRLIYKKEDNLKKALSYLSGMIFMDKGILFNITPVNVKLSLDTSAMRLDLIVTDLARKLTQTYDINC